MSTRGLAFICFCLCSFYQALNAAGITTALPPAIQRSNTGGLVVTVPTSSDTSQPLLFTSLNYGLLNYINDAQVTSAGALAYMTFPGLTFNPDNSPINIGFIQNKLQAIDYSFRLESIFVVELTSLSTSRLRRMTIGSPDVVTVVVAEGMITDISVDWLSSNIYWVDRPVDQQGYPIDGQSGSVKVTRADGQYTLALPWNIAYPWGLSADSVGKRLFWTNYTLGIEQTVIGVINFDGTGLRVLASVSHDQHYIAFNPADRRVYWTGDNTISSIRASDGGDLRVFITVDVLDKTKHIAFYQNFVLWTVESTSSGSLGYAQTANASADVTMVFNETTSNYTAPCGVMVYAEASQPTNTLGPCTQDNGGCQQLCLPRQNNSAQCQCILGYLLGNHGDCILITSTIYTTTPPSAPGISTGSVVALAVVFSCIALAMIGIIIFCIIKKRRDEKATLRAGPQVVEAATYNTLHNIPNDHPYRTLNDANVAPEEPIRTEPQEPQVEHPYEVLPADVVGGPAEGGASVASNLRRSNGTVSSTHTYLSIISSSLSIGGEGGAGAVGVEIDGNPDNDGATQQLAQAEAAEDPPTDYRETADQPITSDPHEYQKLSTEAEQRSPYISMSRDESLVY